MWTRLPSERREDPEGAGPVDLLVEVALTLVNGAEHAVLAGSLCGGAAVFLRRTVPALAAQDVLAASNPNHAPMTHGNFVDGVPHAGKRAWTRAQAA